MPRSLALLPCLVAQMAVAQADPVQISIQGRAEAPARPAITLRAAEPVSALSVVLTPSPASGDKPGARNPETEVQRFTLARLGKGERETRPIGTGRPGSTRWLGAIEYRAGGKAYSYRAEFETLVSRPLKVSYDEQHLDLAARFVEVRLSQPAGRGEVEVYSENGQLIGAGSVEFRGEPPGTWLRIPWTPRGTGNVLKLELVLYDQAGFSSRLTLVPWSVKVPHDEVNFATGSFEIAEAEQRKLRESQGRISALIDQVKGYGVSPTLYVAGHTDSVDTDAYNQRLSENRARAIARGLRALGVSAPILYAGFGERMPLVSTPDNTDEPRNRRTDYVLGTRPPYPGAWKRLP